MEHVIHPRGKNTDASDEIQKAIDLCIDGDTVRFEKGEYLFRKSVTVKNKTNLTIDGASSTFIAYFDREKDIDDAAELFVVNSCANVTLRNFTVTSSSPTNCAVEILDVTEDHVDFRADAVVPLTGKEYCIDGMAFIRSGNPEDDGEALRKFWVSTDYDENQRTIIAGELCCTNPKRLNVPHEKIGDQTFRMYPNVNVLERGMWATLEHCYYGKVAFTFRDATDTLVQNVTVNDYAGFAFIILPRCRNFTFKGLRIESYDKVRKPYAIAADGIHITGLTGKLLLEDCYFENLGDDTINIHTQVMTIKEIKDGLLRIVYDKKGGTVSQRWGKPGDELNVFDKDTLERKGTVKIRCVDGEWISTGSDLSFINNEDFVTNSLYYPETVFRRVRITKQRNRSLLADAVSSLLIEDCEFDHIADAAVYLSCAFYKWREAGPVRNVTVRNCLFTGRTVPLPRFAPKQGVIDVRIVGERHEHLSHIHKNVRIENNTFRNIGYCLVSAMGTDGIEVSGNIAEGCSFENEEPFVFQNCTDVSVHDNKL